MISLWSILVIKYVIWELSLILGIKLYIYTYIYKERGEGERDIYIYNVSSMGVYSYTEVDLY